MFRRVVFLGAAAWLVVFTYGLARKASANHATAANELTVASTAANTTLPLATNFNVTLAVTTSTTAYTFVQWELAYSSNISFVSDVYTCAQFPGEVETATVEAPNGLPSTLPGATILGGGAGCASLSGAFAGTTTLGVFVTVTLQCVSNGTTPVFGVDLATDPFFGTTLGDRFAANIGTTLENQYTTQSYGLRSGFDVTCGAASTPTTTGNLLTALTATPPAAAVLPSPPKATDPPTPTPAAISQMDLQLVSADQNAEMAKDPIIDDGEGKRAAGQFFFLAGRDFQTRALRSVSSHVALIAESEPGARTGERIVVVRVPESELDIAMKLAALLPGVPAVDKNWVFELAATPNDPEWPAQLETGLGQLHLDNAWDVSQGLPSVRVAVMDSGFSYQQCLPSCTAELPNITSGHSVFGGDMIDYTGHGTAVASIIGARRNNNYQIAGVAPSVAIVPVKVCDYAEQCVAADLGAGLFWLNQSEEVDVVNMSLGWAAENNTTVRTELDKLAAKHVIAVASAGNGGTTPLLFPANYGEVISVAGTKPDGTRDLNSDYGPGLDVAAPYHAWAVTRDGFDDDYFGGTSYSAPVIAGLAALFKSTQPLWSVTNDATAFLKAMKRSPTGYEFDIQWNIETGYGIPDAFSTIWAGACLRYDFDHNHTIDIGDDQAMAFRYGQFDWPGAFFYSRWYDVSPPLRPDGDIDIMDLQTVFGRSGRDCPT